MNDDKYWIFHNNELKNELGVIITHFQCLIDTITKLEKSNVTLRDSLLLIENIKIKFEEGGAVIDFARSKFTNVLSKNRGYSTLEKFDDIINSEVT
jgi:hypothetical protein